MAPNENVASGCNFAVFQGCTSEQRLSALAMGPKVPAKSGKAVTANQSRLCFVSIKCSTGLLGFLTFEAPRSVQEALPSFLVSIGGL